MAVSISELKRAAALISEKYNISGEDSRRVIGSYKANDTIKDILSGDFSTVPAAAASVGVVLGSLQEKTAADCLQDIKAHSVPGEGVNTETKTKKRRAASADHASNDKKTAVKRQNKPVTASKQNKPINDGLNNINALQAETSADIIPTIDGDIINKHDLPQNFAETVRGWLLDIQAREGWEDLTKISALQWRAACQYVGYNIKQSKILYDFDFLRVHGGSVAYDPYKAEKLLAIWDHFTCIYKHVPILADFINFCGVSHEWFFNDNRQDLTAARVELAQKARRLCESGLESALTDSRENPTGRIFTAKARYGWQEQTTINHVSAAAVVNSSELPKLADNII